MMKYDSKNHINNLFFLINNKMMKLDKEISYWFNTYFLRLENHWKKLRKIFKIQQFIMKWKKKIIIN